MCISAPGGQGSDLDPSFPEGLAKSQALGDVSALTSQAGTERRA